MSWIERRRERSFRRCRNYRRQKFAERSFWAAMVLFVVIPLLGQLLADNGIIKPFVLPEVEAFFILLGIFSVVAPVVAWAWYNSEHHHAKCRCDELAPFADALEDLKRRVGEIESKVRW